MLRKLCIDVANLYGINLHYVMAIITNDVELEENEILEGLYVPDNTILIRVTGDEFDMAKTFCHEVGHYLLDQYGHDYENERSANKIAFLVWKTHFENYQVLDPSDFQD